MLPTPARRGLPHAEIEGLRALARARRDASLESFRRRLRAGVPRQPSTPPEERRGASSVGRAAPRPLREAR